MEMQQEKLLKIGALARNERTKTALKTKLRAKDHSTLLEKKKKKKS